MLALLFPTAAAARTGCNYRGHARTRAHTHIYMQSATSTEHSSAGSSSLSQQTKLLAPLHTLLHTLIRSLPRCRLIIIQQQQHHHHCSSSHTQSITSTASTRCTSVQGSRGLSPRRSGVPPGPGSSAAGRVWTAHPAACLTAGPPSHTAHLWPKCTCGQSQGGTGMAGTHTHTCEPAILQQAAEGQRLRCHGSKTRLVVVYPT